MNYGPLDKRCQLGLQRSVYIMYNNRILLYF
jgi:hypothetical protein